VDVQRATQTVSALIYFALLVATVRFWERQRERVVVWLIATFGLLSLLAILGWALPDEDVSLAGLALWSGASWARWFTIVVASINVLGQLSFLGSSAYPVWTLTAITLNIVVIYALTVRWAGYSDAYMD